MSDHSPSELEKLSPLEYWLETEFKEMYKSQVEIFRKVGLLELLPESGEMGIRGMDGNEYPIPTMEQMKAEMRMNKEKYETKIKQGFTQIQMTPFGVPLEKLTTILEQRILAHHKEGKFFATKANLTDPDEPLQLDTNQPLYKWDGWIDPNAPEGQRGADETGKCVYHPTALEQQGHGGHTKAEILHAQIKTNSPFPGWEVNFMEANPNIPREGKGQTIGGRKQLETNQTPIDYLTQLQTDPQYRHEHGQTNEDWITKFIIHLEKTNQVIDDWQGKGSSCFLPGSFNPASRVLGYGFWDRGDRRAGLSRNGPGHRYSGYGLRPAVGLGHNLKF